MVQAVGASAGLRVIKRVDQTLQELGVRSVLDAHKINLWNGIHIFQQPPFLGEFEA